MKYILLAALVMVPVAAFAQELVEYVPLTNIPELTGLARQETLEGFLQTVYRLCIGIAAVLAVLQIMRAGIMYMGGDSITEKKEARKLIGLSIAGLILVLSPTIVFGIINRDILNLKIDGIEDLKLGERGLNDLGQPDTCENNAGGCANAPDPTAPGCPVKFSNGQIIDPNNQQHVSCCASQSNEFAKCQVQARSNSDMTQTTYCGCDITAPALTYHNVYLFRKVNGFGNAETTTLEGTARDDKPRLDTYSQKCVAAGGEVKTKEERTFVGNFIDQYSDCPASSGQSSAKVENPDGTYNQFKCKVFIAECIEK